MESLLLRYWKFAFWTLRQLRSDRPSAIICMQPPLPALIVCWIYCLQRPKVRLLADLHSGALNNPKWRWSKPVLRRVLRGRGAIVTGSAYARVVQSWGAKSFIVHDPLQLRQLTAPDTEHYFVCAAGWASDEPLEELVRAFSTLPYQLKITGKVKYDLDLPANVICTGFLDDEAFDELLSRCLAVVSLTTRAETMQRGGYEALERGKPLLTSDTRILRDYYGDSAIYCTPDSNSIRSGAAELVANYDAYTLRVRSLQRRVHADGESSLLELRNYING